MINPRFHIYRLFTNQLSPSFFCGLSFPSRKFNSNNTLRKSIHILSKYLNVDTTMSEIPTIEQSGHYFYANIQNSDHFTTVFVNKWFLLAVSTSLSPIQYSGSYNPAVTLITNENILQITSHTIAPILRFCLERVLFLTSSSHLTLPRDTSSFLASVTH